MLSNENVHSHSILCHLISRFPYVFLTGNLGNGNYFFFPGKREFGIFVAKFYWEYGKPKFPLKLIKILKNGDFYFFGRGGGIRA